MKLTTIWTLRGMSLRERLNRTGELAVQTLAHHLPRKLAYWSFIDSGVRAIGPREEVPDVRYIDLLKRLEH
jgi:hypothetical protein